MLVLIADKFEQSGRDGLQALGCDVSFQPDLKDETLVAAITETRPDVLVVRGTKVTEPMLDVGSDQAGRPGRGRLQHDRRGGGLKARHLCFKLSWEKLDCRGGVGVRTDPCSGSSDR